MSNPQPNNQQDFYNYNIYTIIASIGYSQMP